MGFLSALELAITTGIAGATVTRAVLIEVVMKVESAGGRVEGTLDTLTLHLPHHFIPQIQSVELGREKLPVSSWNELGFHPGGCEAEIHPVHLHPQFG